MRGCVLIWSVVILAAVSSISQDRAHFSELNRESREFARQRDWKSLRVTLLEMGKEMPGLTPVFMLRMASVETHLGNKTEALAWMRRYAAAGLNYDVTSDKDLSPLADEKVYQSIAAEMRSRAKPVATADFVCTLPLRDMMPEDITFDKSSGTFIVSSIQHHTLYRVSLPKNDGSECGLREILLEDSAKRWPVMALGYDPKRNLLWLTASALPGFSGFAAGESGKAALFAVNGTSGKVVRRFDTGDTAPTILGDMCVARDGTVYVSDSIGGGVYRLQGDVNSATLEKVADRLFSPQTPALARDGRRLFVADYPMGIAIIDLREKPRTPKYLAHSEEVVASGLDGLYLSGDSLIGIQNGTEPERIVRFRLNDEQTQITGVEVMEQGPRLGEPTHAVAVDGVFFALANVGWNKVDDHGRLKPGQEFTAPILLRLPAQPR